ncbi:hypothetical protein [Pedobacter boryungensis]|uniref:Uncharacterized protein n=1 Tax=Pedobacter boryungensis TaxID=869962 RepID=A0ABX2D854_9SPHI|nr:hypothetical protein [Pedobacter boryungensis]NQX30230.1 hypothetical protein [Pedobacter boryungensis]
MIDKTTPINVIRFDVNLNPDLTQANEVDCNIDYDLGRSQISGQNYLVLHWQLVAYDQLNNVLVNYCSSRVCTLTITSKQEDFVSLINYLNNYYFEVALDFEEKLPNRSDFNFVDLSTLLNETARKIIVSLTKLGIYHKLPRVEIHSFNAMQQKRHKKSIKEVIN